MKLGFISPQGIEKVVEIIRPGQSFGEALMFLDKPYIVFAQTLSDTMVLHVAKEAVLEELGHDPRSRGMLSGLSLRLHGLVRDVEAYRLRSGRSASSAICLPRCPRTPRERAAEVELTPGKGAIASRLNMTPEHFCILHELAADKLIEVNGRAVRIPASSGCAAASGGYFFAFICAIRFFSSARIFASIAASGVLPLAARRARHVGHSARKFFQLEIGLAAPRRHVAHAHPRVRREHVLAFLDERRPGRAVAELRRLFHLGSVAGEAGFLVHVLAALRLCLRRTRYQAHRYRQDERLHGFAHCRSSMEFPSGIADLGAGIARPLSRPPGRLDALRLELGERLRRGHRPPAPSCDSRDARPRRAARGSSR